MHKFLCCLLSGLLAVAAVCLPIGSSVAAEQQISRTGITIPEDTVLQLELMNFLESKRNKVGDTVSVKLLEAVSVADEVIIPKGTVLEGYLKKVQKGKLLSQKGVIRMRLKDYYLPNGYLLRLNNEEIKFSGDMNYTSLAAGVAVPLLGLDSDTFYIYHVTAVMVDNLRRLLLGINLSDKAVMDFDFPGVGFPV